MDPGFDISNTKEDLLGSQVSVVILTCLSALCPEADARGTPAFRAKMSGVSVSSHLSLWALPSTLDRNLYREQTRQLLGARWVGHFEPHVTLLESLTGDGAEREILAKTAACTAPFSIELTELANTASYFRCVVAVVRPEGGIVDLHSNLLRGLGRPTNEYWPHLSLVYAELGESAREKLASEVTAEFPAMVTIEKICIVDTGGELAPRWPLLTTWHLGPV